MAVLFPRLRDREQEIRARLAAAAVFRAVALGFSMPAPGLVPAVREALRNLAQPARDGLLPVAVKRRLRVATQAWQTAAPGQVMADYLQLFQGSATVSLHETAYGDGKRVHGRPVELADINGYYRAFGFTAHRDNPDLPDHISAEFEFLSLLLVKEGYALSHGWPARHALTASAAAGFLKDHLGRWVRALALALGRAGVPDCWRSLLDLGIAMLDDECRRHRIRPVTLTERAPPDDMQSEELVCPHAAGAPAQGPALPAAAPAAPC